MELPKFEKKYYRRYKSTINTSPITGKDNSYLEKIGKNCIAKSAKRLEELKKRISNDIKKNNYTKYYQVKSMYEVGELKKYVLTINSKYPLWWCNNLKPENTLTMNALKKIIGSEQADYPSDDEKIEFVNEKTPVIFCYFNTVF